MTKQFGKYYLIVFTVIVTTMMFLLAFTLSHNIEIVSAQEEQDEQDEQLLEQIHEIFPMPKVISTTKLWIYIPSLHPASPKWGMPSMRKAGGKLM